MANDTQRWAAIQLARIRRDEGRFKYEQERERARTDADYTQRLAETAEFGRTMTGPFGFAKAELPLMGAAFLGPVGLAASTAGFAGLGAARIHEGLQRRKEGLPHTGEQIGFGALDVAAPGIMPALRGLKGAFKTVKGTPPVVSRMVGGTKVFTQPGKNLGTPFIETSKDAAARVKGKGKVQPMETILGRGVKDEPLPKQWWQQEGPKGGSIGHYDPVKGVTDTPLSGIGPEDFAGEVRRPAHTQLHPDRVQQNINQTGDEWARVVAQHNIPVPLGSRGLRWEPGAAARARGAPLRQAVNLSDPAAVWPSMQNWKLPDKLVDDVAKRHVDALQGRYIWVEDLFAAEQRAQGQKSTSPQWLETMGEAIPTTERRAGWFDRLTGSKFHPDTRDRHLGVLAGQPQPGTGGRPPLGPPGSGAPGELAQINPFEWHGMDEWRRYFMGEGPRPAIRPTRVSGESYYEELAKKRGGAGGPAPPAPPTAPPTSPAPTGPPGEARLFKALGAKLGREANEIDLQQELQRLQAVEARIKAGEFPSGGRSIKQVKAKIQRLQKELGQVAEVGPARIPFTRGGPHAGLEGPGILRGAAVGELGYRGGVGGLSQGRVFRGGEHVSTPTPVLNAEAKDLLGKEKRGKQREYALAVEDVASPLTQRQIEWKARVIQRHMLEPLLATFLTRMGGPAIVTGVSRAATGGAVRPEEVMGGLKQFLSTPSGKQAAAADIYAVLGTTDDTLREIIRRGMVSYTPEGQRYLANFQGAPESYRIMGGAHPGSDQSLTAMLATPDPLVAAYNPAVETKRHFDKMANALGAEGLEVVPRELGGATDPVIYRHIEDKMRAIESVLGYEVQHEDQILAILKRDLHGMIENFDDAVAKRWMAREVTRSKIAKQKAYARKVEGLGTSSKQLIQQEQAAYHELSDKMGTSNIQQALHELGDVFELGTASTSGPAWGVTGVLRLLADDVKIDDILTAQYEKIGDALARYSRKNLPPEAALQRERFTLQELMKIADGADIKLAGANEADQMRHLQSNVIAPEDMQLFYKQAFYDAGPGRARPSKAEQAFQQTRKGAPDILRSALGPRDAEGVQRLAVFNLMRQTGLQPAQLSNMLVEDVDILNGVVRVWSRLKGKTKARLKLSIPISDDVGASLGLMLSNRYRLQKHHRRLRTLWGLRSRMNKQPLFPATTTGHKKAPATIGKMIAGPNGVITRAFKQQRLEQLGLKELPADETKRIQGQVEGQYGPRRLRQHAAQMAGDAKTAALILGHSDQGAMARGWYLDKSTPTAAGRRAFQIDANAGPISKAEREALGDTLYAHVVRPGNAWLQQAARQGDPGIQEAYRADIEEVVGEIGAVMQDAGRTRPAISQRVGQQDIVNYPLLGKLSAMGPGVGPTGRQLGTPPAVMTPETVPDITGALTPQFQELLGRELNVPLTRMGRRLKIAAVEPGAQEQFRGERVFDRFVRTLANEKSAHIRPNMSGEQIDDSFRQFRAAVEEVQERGGNVAEDPTILERVHRAMTEAGYTTSTGSMGGQMVTGGQMVIDGVEIRAQGLAEFLTRPFPLTKPGVGKPSIEQFQWGDEVEARAYFDELTNLVHGLDPKVLEEPVERINAAFAEAVERQFLDVDDVQRFWGEEGEYIRSLVLSKFILADSVKAVETTLLKRFGDLIRSPAAQESGMEAVFSGSDRTVIKTNIPRHTYRGIEEEIPTHQVRQGLHGIYAELRSLALHDLEDFMRTVKGQYPGRAGVAPEAQTVMRDANDIVTGRADFRSPAFWDFFKLTNTYRLHAGVGPARVGAKYAEGKDFAGAVAKALGAILPFIVLPEMAAAELGV